MKRAITLLLLLLLVLACGCAGGSADVTTESVSEADEANNTGTSPEGDAVVESSAVNLVFIHHSVGENWLNDGLCRALNDRGYNVADIYYGWREYGDRTDTVDWPLWFTDEVMGLVYQEMGNMTAPNTLRPAPGENTIVMFKSCFPNSDVGSDISDEKAIYEQPAPLHAAAPRQDVRACHSATHAGDLRSAQDPRAMRLAGGQAVRLVGGPDHRERLRVRPLQRAHRIPTHITGW